MPSKGRFFVLSVGRIRTTCVALGDYLGSHVVYGDVNVTNVKIHGRDQLDPCNF
jgi:hypothetical protein